MKTQKTKKPEIISDFFNFLENFSAYIFILESIKHQYIYSSTRSKIREKILIMLRLKSYAGEEKLISSGRVTIRTRRISPPFAIRFLNVRNYQTSR